MAMPRRTRKRIRRRGIGPGYARGMGSTVNLFDIINIPLGYLLKLCYKLIPNYALALLLFAVIIKAVLFPLGIKQQKNSVKQAQLRPKEQAIRKRYAGRTDKATQMKMNEELQQLYQAENFNPMGGCLPLFIELPIVFSLYQVITHPLKYLMNWSDELITSVTDRITELGGTAASQIKVIGILKENLPTYADLLPEGTTAASLPNFHLAGSFLDLSETPSFSNFGWLLLIPVLTFAAAFFSMKITRRFTYQPQTDEQTALSMKIMDLTMPLFSVWIAFTVPAVVGLYWVYQNLLTALRQVILYKMYPLPVFTEEDYKAAEREMNGKLSKADKKKMKVHSLHNIDDEIPDTPENTLLEAPEDQKAKNGLAVGAIKDEGASPKDQPGQPKKKVHSLHRIDEEIPDTPENTLMLDENGRRIRSLDQAASGEEPKKENDDEKKDGSEEPADKKSEDDKSAPDTTEK